MKSDKMVLAQWQIGEEKASAYLRERGCVILERNWRVGHKEIDIICKDKDIVVVVEVKTRSQSEEVIPAELLDYKKKRNLIRAGEGYLRKKGLTNEMRFDLIIVDSETDEIRHIQEAIQIFEV